MSNKSSKLNKNPFKYAMLSNFSTAGVRRSFGIHDLHRRFMKHQKASTKDDTTVELTTSNSDFCTVNDKESTEDMNEIELFEVEVLPCISIPLFSYMS